MSAFTYEIIKNQAINTWRYTKIAKEAFITEATTINAPVNMTEGYLEVEYPVRKAFLASLKEIQLDPACNFSQFYYGFENPRVDFSTFITTPHKLTTYLKNMLSSPKNQEVNFLLTTCGRAVVWLNGHKICDFHPYTRNHGTTKKITLPLVAGDNELIIYMDDLAERDVNYFIELRLVSETSLKVNVPLTYDGKALRESIDFLNGLYLEKDMYTSGDIRLLSDTQADKTVCLSFKDPLFMDLDDETGGNITDFSRGRQQLTFQDGSLKIGRVETLATSGLTKIFVGLQLPDTNYLFKKFVFTSYNESQLNSGLGVNLSERKARALAIFSELELADMNSGIAMLHLNHQLTDTVKKKLQPAYSMIENRGDCADFMFAPLLSYTLMEKTTLPPAFLDDIQELALGFRYWIDEPGNDVMWYFSENHSLLFHVCQYFAGFLYPEELFKTSQRLGKVQYQLGRRRLEEWFAQFKKVGFSEWNSATYLPIDLIGFFSLYNAAPDKEIKDLAKEALDYTFKIMAINYHGGTLSSTFGRTYEHDLKAMKLGEISNLLAIAWDVGYFNYALRSSTLFCLSDYQPPQEYLAYIQLKTDEYVTANYLQGMNQVETYLYKCSDYSLASAIRYNVFQKGHQQHMMNISLGSDGTQLWLNNPGEYMHSGENRPSYWAGNGVCPKIQQYKNTMILEYQLKEADVKNIHLYLPYWNLTDIHSEDPHWLFVAKDTSYLAVYFSEGYWIEATGDTRGREVVSLGEEQTVIVKVANQQEAVSFENFKQKLSASTIGSKTFWDFQWGQLAWDNYLTVNHQVIESTASYQLSVIVEKENEKEEGIHSGKN